jgi:hypothetical protein
MIADTPVSSRTTPPLLGLHFGVSIDGDPLPPRARDEVSMALTSEPAAPHNAGWDEFLISIKGEGYAQGVSILGHNECVWHIERPGSDLSLHAFI